MTEKDSLERIVELARKEGALEGRKLRSFVEALRDRARLILDERVEPLAMRADAFEKESRWRAEIQRGLEGETQWRREAMETLETRVAALEAENTWRTKEGSRLLAEIECLREEWRTASAAHDRLLAHHRSLLARVAESLDTVTTWIPWSYKRARARIAELAATLRKELP